MERWSHAPTPAPSLFHIPGSTAYAVKGHAHTQHKYIFKTKDSPTYNDGDVLTLSGLAGVTGWYFRFVNGLVPPLLCNYSNMSLRLHYTRWYQIQCTSMDLVIFIVKLVVVILLLPHMMSSGIPRWPIINSDGSSTTGSEPSSVKVISTHCYIITSFLHIC